MKSPAPTVFLLTTISLLSAVWRTDARSRHLQSPIVYCKSNADCESSPELTGGETCRWLFDGCSVGQCMCDPARQKRHPATGKCINARLGGDSCVDSSECVDSMFCSATSHVCQCRTGQMTADRQHCLRRRHKVLGQVCSTSVDTCYQRAVYGYTDNEVGCSASSGLCECNEGWRRNGISCGSRKLGEKGCTKFFHCEGGAICNDNQCVCPHGYTGSSSDDNAKCIKRGAVRDLPIGAECDEINERRYCAEGLVCHHCTESPDSAFLCVRFRKTALLSDVSASSAGTRSHPSSSPTSLVNRTLWTSCALLSVVLNLSLFYRRTQAGRGSAAATVDGFR